MAALARGLAFAAMNCRDAMGRIVPVVLVSNFQLPRSMQAPGLTFRQIVSDVSVESKEVPGQSSLRALRVLFSLPGRRGATSDAVEQLTSL